MEHLRLLSVSAATGKIGFVLFIGDKPTDWALSRKASTDAEAATRYMQDLVTRFRPDVIITEHVTERCRKGEKTLGNIEAVSRVAADASGIDVRVPRPRYATNKFDEALALCETWPELLVRLPRKRRLWEAEPRSMILFEAASMAKVIFDDPTNRLAAAMG